MSKTTYNEVKFDVINFVSPSSGRNLPLFLLNDHVHPDEIGVGDYEQDVVGVHGLVVVMVIGFHNVNLLLGGYHLFWGLEVHF